MYSRLTNNAIDNPAHADNPAERLRAEALFVNPKTRIDAAIIFLVYREFLNGRQMTCLGKCYFEGDGVLVNYNDALRWFKKAAELGDSNAMYNIGMSHLKGLGSYQDYYSAYEWFRKSADLGNGYAMIRIGDMYRPNSRAVFRSSTEEAKKWYQMAIEHGAKRYPNTNYGLRLHSTYDLIWYFKFAEEGDTEAMFEVGKCYADGDGGLEKDKEKAQYWLKKAADLGNNKATKLLMSL